MTTYAKAYPQKRLFVEMFTRDLSLEDCLLDLIDNSIDALFHQRKLDFSNEVWAYTRDPSSKVAATLPTVDLTIEPKAIRVKDNCGGIPYKSAREDVFNFGHSATFDPSAEMHRLGAYGIGLKRALFKLGHHFELASFHGSDAFRAWLDLDVWLNSGNHPDTWRIPLAKLPSAPKRKGTTDIVVTRLRDDILQRISDPLFRGSLGDMIGKTYALFLERFVRVTIDGVPIQPKRIPLGSSEEVQPGLDVFDDDGVSVKIMSSLAARQGSGQWLSEVAGWYVFCNGRAVLFADKTELTGWGAGLLPNFNTKLRGFVGLVFFQSDDPLKLPWTTTKRGINRESPVFQSARARMAAAARPVITFLDRMYAAEAPEPPVERDMADGVEVTDLRRLVSTSERVFAAVPKRAVRKRTVRVQYDAERDDIEMIKKHLRQPSLTAAKIGAHTLEYFIEAEGLR